MFNPPITGNDELDAFLSQLVLEGISSGASGLSANSSTGIISDNDGNIVGYIYRYLAIKYADDNVGTNISDSPTNKSFYGICNSDLSSEPSTPASYTWYQVTGGFGTTKFLWYQAVGGRKVNFAVSPTLPASGWVVDSGTSIDADLVTSGSNIVIVDSFSSFFSPAVMQVPRTGNPLTPVFSNIAPKLYASNANVLVTFVASQTDADAGFVNNTWRVGNSSSSGFADISYNNVTFNNPTVSNGAALWGNPTSMSGSPATVTVPIRFKNSAGVITQASVATLQLIFADPGATGSSGPSLDISGYTSFVQNTGGAFTPVNTILTAITSNITSPTYGWAITGATPSTASTASVTVTPLSASTKVDVTLTVNGSNLASPITKSISMPVVYNGATGQAGANGVMSAFPTIYRWTSSSTPPARPSTTSTYTWSTGSFTPPTGWYTSAPGETTPGYYLWSMTAPINEVATAISSVLDWTNVSIPIRATAYNGTNGSTGSTGSSGSATFVVTRFANDSSAPTNAEVNTVIGRNPVAGDIVTVSYNNYNNATVYKFTNSWILFTTYITGSLIVENTITGDKLAANTVTADRIDSRNLTIKDAAGNIIFGSSNDLDYSRIIASNNWLNNNITISGGAINGIGSGTGTAVANNAITLNSNGTLSGAGGGAVTASGIGAVRTDLANAPAGILNSNVSLGTLGAGAFAYLNQVTSANVSTYISGAAIGTAQIGVLTAGNIGAGTIDASKIAANTITADKINSGTVFTNSLQVGSAPAVSGTTMTGSGGILNSNGTFALGNNSTNITYNGSAMYLNGNVVSTGNINTNAVTTSLGAELASDTTLASTGFPATYTTIFSTTINTGGSPLFLLANTVSYLINDYGFFGVYIYLELTVNGTRVTYFNNYQNRVAVSKVLTAYLDSTPTGNFNVTLRGYTFGDSYVTGLALCATTSVILANGGTSLFAIGLKR